MKLTFAAKTMPASEGTVSRHIHSHVKHKEGFFPVVSLGYLIVCGPAYQTGFSEGDTSHLSLVVGSAWHKESSVCLDENVDGLDVARAKGTLRQRAASLMC